MADYFQSKYFTSLSPIPGSQVSVKKLSEWFDIYVVTSRQYFLEQQTRAWLALHFPDIITEVYFGNAYGIGPSRSKKEILNTMENVVAIIDDIPSTCIACAELWSQSSFLSILFDFQGGYKWSKLTVEVPHNVVTVKSWEEVIVKLAICFPS